MSNATLNHRCFLLAAALGAALSGLPEAGAQNRRVSAAPLSPDMLKQRVLDSQVPAQESAGDILCSGDAANLLYPLDESFVLVDFFGDGCTGSGCAQGPDQHNDDDSAIVALPFTYDLYSDQYTTCFINNNGNLTFGTVFSGFSAVGFPSAGIPAMVAPFWGDVDTGNPANFVGDVWMKFVDSNGDELDDTLVVTWENVGYFNEHGDLRNTFQVAISDGTNPLIGPNNNVAFSFDNMCWTTGDASSGIGGFGGIPATVGANRGNGVDFFQIGRFDHEGVDYDGPFGDNDGVSFLDGQITAFNTATATTNIPPIPTNFPPGNLVTVDGDLAEVLELDLQFLSPEQAQTTTVEVVDLDGAQAAGLSITNTPGNVAVVELDWITEPADAGLYVLAFTATDDFDPPGVTTIDLTIEVLGSQAPDCNENGIPDDQDILDGTSADLNGNGIPDECEGEADFGDPDETSAAGAPNIEAIGDMDGDGDDDVVTAIPDLDAQVPGAVQVFINQGVDVNDVWLGLTANDPITVGRNPTAIAVGFFDGDGHLDVAVTNRTDNTISILLNLGLGDGDLFVAGTVAVGNDPSGIVAEDFNEDGFIDLAVTLETDQSFEIFFGDGTGNFTFAPGPEFTSIGFNPVGMSSGDFDGNKCPDLAGIGTAFAAAINGVGSPGKVFVALGLGNGTFAAPQVFDVGLNPRDLSICDVNQDGSLDIITANRDDNTLSVLLNLGDGTFGTALPLAVGQQPRAVACADLSADGVPDIAVVALDAEIGPAVQVLQNTIGASAGGVFFDPPVAFSVDADPNFVVTADLDQDGAFDLVTVTEDSVSVLLGEPAAISFPASLDIKPATCPNSFNRESNGKFPIALVGREDFDVSLVDISTLRLSRAAGIGGELSPFEGPPGPHTVIEDAATPFGGELCDCDALAGDGLPDLSMKFSRPLMTSVLALEGLDPGANVELVLSGSLLDGTPFQARDCIQIVPDGAPAEMAVRSNGPTVFVDVSPPDTDFNAGGYVNFDRTYVEATAVTLTAPALYQGWVFVGWRLSGPGIAIYQDYGPLLGDLSIEVFVGPGLQEIHAVYVDTLSRSQPAPVTAP